MWRMVCKWAMTEVKRLVRIEDSSVFQVRENGLGQVDSTDQNDKQSKLEYFEGTAKQVLLKEQMWGEYEKE